MSSDEVVTGRVPRHQVRRQQRDLEAFRSFCQDTVARAKARAEEIDWDSISDEFWTDFYSYLFTLIWDAEVEKVPAAQEELQRFREAGEPEVLARDETHRQSRANLDRRDYIRAAEVRRRSRHLPVFSHWRPAGRERRPACNSRTRGSRRSTVTSGQDPGDPHLGDDDPPEDSESDAESRIAKRWIRQIRRSLVPSPSEAEVGA